MYEPNFIIELKLRCDYFLFNAIYIYLLNIMKYVLIYFIIKIYLLIIK